MMTSTLNIPQKLPFLEAICWQTINVYNLTPEEMLHRYERGWDYQDVLEKPSLEEENFIKQLIDIYGSWLIVNSELEQHQKALQILHQVNANFFKNCSVYFGGGTFLSLKYNEYRVSQDIDFLCSSGEGYNALRQAIFERGYEAIFSTTEQIHFPREIQANQYGIRFPVIVDNLRTKLEIVREGRIELNEPNYLKGLSVACLNRIDSIAEKLLANADRWPDLSVESRDLIDLSILRLEAPFPNEAIVKAEKAYLVIEPLKRSIINFQNKPDYREKYYTSLKVKSPEMIINGLDLLATDWGLPITQRISQEQKQNEAT